MAKAESVALVIAAWLDDVPTKDLTALAYTFTAIAPGVAGLF